jgi:hypothetical protein
MDVSALVPLTPGARVGIRGPHQAFEERTPGAVVVPLDGTLGRAGDRVDVLVTEAGATGEVDVSCLRPGGWLVATVPPSRVAARRVARLTRRLAAAQFRDIVVFGAEPWASEPHMLVPVDAVQPVRDLFARVMVPLTTADELRARLAGLLTHLGRSRWAFRSFLVVAHRAP